MDKGAWQATVHGVEKSQTRLNNYHSSLTHDQLLNHKQCFGSVKVLVTQSCPTLWDFPDKNTGVGCHFLLQGIFPTWGLNPRLLRWQADSLLSSPPGKPKPHIFLAASLIQPSPQSQCFYTRLLFLLRILYHMVFGLFIFKKYNHLAFEQSYIQPKFFLVPPLYAIHEAGETGNEAER